MGIKDAKTILSDVLKCEVLDSMVTFYQNKDKVSAKIISLQKQIQDKQDKQIEIMEGQITNYEKIVSNKDKEISMQNEIIREQRKEIRKQKLLKIAGFSGSVILPVITALLILK